MKIEFDATDTRFSENDRTLIQQAEAALASWEFVVGIQSNGTTTQQ